MTLTRPGLLWLILAAPGVAALVGLSPLACATSSDSPEPSTGDAASPSDDGGGTLPDSATTSNGDGSADAATSDAGSCVPVQDVAGARVLFRSQSSASFLAASPTMLYLRLANDASVLAIARTGSSCAVTISAPAPHTKVHQVVARANDITFFGVGDSLHGQVVYKQASAGAPLVELANTLLPDGSAAPLGALFGDETSLYALVDPFDLRKLDDTTGVMTLYADVAPAGAGGAAPSNFRMIDGFVVSDYTTLNSAKSWQGGTSTTVLSLLNPFDIVSLADGKVDFIDDPGGQSKLLRAATGADTGDPMTPLYGPKVRRARRLGTEMLVAESMTSPTPHLELRRVSSAGVATTLSTIPVGDCPVIEANKAICVDAVRRWLEIAF
jgi:hypothetical protein